MSRLLTLSEFVDECFPVDEYEFALYTRRVRAWTAAGVIPTVPRPHGRRGTGHHRLYRAEDARRISLLLVLANLGIPPSIEGQLEYAIDALTDLRRVKYDKSPAAK